MFRTTTSTDFAKIPRLTDAMTLLLATRPPGPHFTLRQLVYLVICNRYTLTEAYD